MSLAIAARRAALTPGWVRDPLWRRAGAMPTLDLQFASRKNLVDAAIGKSPVTFTRASTATYVGSDGLIKSAAVNEPRFDHDPTTGASLGLLIEQQRTNLLLHNRTLTNAAWTTANITAAKDQVGVDGASNSASSITATAGNGTILQAVTSASAAQATSAYVRRITGTGTVEMTQDGGTTWTAVTVTGSWTRVTIPSATVTNPSVGFRIVTSGDAIAVDYVQLENGTYSLSAIETTTATVTRSADVASVTGTNFIDFYSDAGSSVLAYAQSIGLSLGNEYLAGIGSASDGAQIRETNAQMIGMLRGTYGQDVNSLLLPQGLRRICLAYAPLNTGALAMNGILYTSTATAAATLTAPTSMFIGASGDGNGPWNGTISRLTYWPRRLPNAVLQAITQ